MLRHHSRGQAIPEFAFTIALLVSSMMFIFVVARYGVISERAATALRIAGTVTQNQNPYRFASLDTAYRAADNSYNAGSDQKTCTPPDSQILYGMGLLSGAASAKFWNPSRIPSAPTCAFSMTRFKNTAIRTQGDLLVHQFDYTISAEAGGWTSTVANSAGTLFGGTKQRIAESARFYQAPSLETLIQCYTNLGPALSASLNPAQDVSNAPSTTPLSQGEAAAIRLSLAVSPTACLGLTLAAGPYQIPPPPLAFPAGAAPPGTFWNQSAAASNGSNGSSTTPGSSTHGKFNRVNAYQPPSTPAPPSKPKPSGGGSSGSSGSKPGGSSGGTSKSGGSSSPGGSTSGGSSGSSGSSGSGSSGSTGSSGSSSSGSGGSGSGTITL